MKSTPKALAAHKAKVTGSQQRSQIRINKILESAQHILINEGFHSLSLRKIAQHMGISNGNVTYYFPNKKVLLRALIEDMLSRYDAEYELEAATFPNAPLKRINAYFQYLINDAQNADSRNFFYQLWGLSTHDPIAAELREEVYGHFYNQLLTQLKAVRPELSSSELKSKTFLLMSMVEGINVILGSGANFTGQFDGIDTYLEKQIMALVIN